MRLAGEADVRAAELRDALAAELAARPRLLLIDMSALTFIDSGATQMITAAHRIANREGQTLALLSPTDPVARVLSLMGVDRVIGVYGSVDEAVAAAMGVLLAVLSLLVLTLLVLILLTRVLGALPVVDAELALRRVLGVLLGFLHLLRVLLGVLRPCL
jgi:anti-sigma B factor antagonist